MPRPSFPSSCRLPSWARRARPPRPCARRSRGRSSPGATLGKALEHAGLTTHDSQALIARQERAAYQLTPPAAQRLSPELDELHGHVLALAKSGALSSRAEEAVAANKARARRTKPRKAA